MSKWTIVPTIIDFGQDPQLLGLTLSPAQETLLRGAYGLLPSPEQLAIWRLCTGRMQYPAQAFGVTVVAGAAMGAAWAGSRTVRSGSGRRVGQCRKLGTVHLACTVNSAEASTSSPVRASVR
jgi:hypothetical protein